MCNTLFFVKIWALSSVIMWLWSKHTQTSVMDCCSCVCQLIYASLCGSQWSGVLIPFRRNKSVLSNSWWELRYLSLISFVLEFCFIIMTCDLVYSFTKHVINYKNNCKCYLCSVIRLHQKPVWVGGLACLKFLVLGLMSFDFNDELMGSVWISSEAVV